MKNKYTILVDSREKKPLLFPSNLVMMDRSSPRTSLKTKTVQLVVETATLDVADYQIKGADGIAAVETKRSLDELASNCCTGRGRRNFIAELEALRAAWKCPLLLVEGTPLHMATTKHTKIPPQVARDSLLELLEQYRITMYMLPSTSAAHRRATAEWVAAFLINGVELYGSSQ